jgi:hypothetical protein
MQQAESWLLAIVMVVIPAIMCVWAIAEAVK